MTVDYIPESHIRLYSTATSGVPAEHSHYYRRMISAGYKGYVQGTVAGATLYGLLGGLVGLGVSALLIPVAGTFALAAIPALGGYGVLKGSVIFGSIGSNAAQLAEFAETNERRRALLDRLDETPSQQEAEEIKRLLQDDVIEKDPEQLIHWKTLLVGGIVGAITFAGLGYIGNEAIAAVVEKVLGDTSIAALSKLQIAGSAAAIGGAVGSLVGLDRGWIRKWFNFSEGVVHDRAHYDELTKQRAQEVARLHEIGVEDIRAMEEKRRPLASREALNTYTPSMAQNDSQVPLNRVDAASSKEEGRAKQIEYTPAV